MSTDDKNSPDGEKTPLDDFQAIKDDMAWLAERMRKDGGFLNIMRPFANKVEAGIPKVDTLSAGKAAALRSILDGYRRAHPKVDQRSLLALWDTIKDLLPEGMA